MTRRFLITFRFSGFLFPICNVSSCQPYPIHLPNPSQLITLPLQDIPIQQILLLRRHLHKLTAIPKLSIRPVNASAYLTGKEHGISHGGNHNIKTVFYLEYFPASEHESAQADIHQMNL